MGVCCYKQVEAQQGPNFAQFYRINGYVHLPKVFSSETCKKAIFQAQSLITKSGFATSSDEFNKVSHFFQSAYQNNKQLNKESMIKVGHALHIYQIFKQMTYARPIQDIQSALGVKSPLVIQSMILQKKSIKGGKVTVHQDSTYLLNQPESILGYWVPLQNVDQQNGCIWLLKNSHNYRLYEKFTVVQNRPNYQFQPKDFKEQDFIPIRMQQGDLLIFGGRVLHKSQNNLSGKTRFAYTWHTMESSSTWNPHNWLSMDLIKRYNK